MSEIRLEIPAETVVKARIASELTEIGNINTEFLKLLVHPATQDCCEVLGLDGGVIAALKSLSMEQLSRIAASPQLLARFQPLPGSREIQNVADSDWYQKTDRQWQDQLQSFANRLLACMWQTARHNQFMAAFSTGMSPADYRHLAGQSFTSISRYSVDAGLCLRARLDSHPSFWADLIRSARSDNGALQTVSRLALIPLSVSQRGLRSGR